jgi:large subunit ribosomal protein L10
MVSKKKVSEVTALVELMKGYPVIGLADLFKMPSRQLQNIRKNVRDSILIKMIKKSMVSRALEELKNESLGKLNEFEVKNPAILFTNLNPFKLSRLFEKNKSKTYAKSGDIAPYDLVIHEGPTKLPAGPAIGELQRAKIPAMVKEGKIHVSKDTVVVKKGGIITGDMSNLLKKLDVQPIEIGIDLVAVWENGVIFDKSVLKINEEEFLGKLVSCYNNAMNLAVNIGYPTKGSIKILLQRAYLSAKNIGEYTKFLNKRPEESNSEVVDNA